VLCKNLLYNGRYIHFYTFINTVLVKVYYLMIVTLSRLKYEERNKKKEAKEIAAFEALQNQLQTQSG